MSTPCENCGSDFRVCADCDLYNGKYIEIPDNATNGDMIKAMFGVEEVDMSNTYCVHFPEEEEDYGHYFFKEWWNSTYQKEDTNRKNCEYRHENGNCLKVGGFCTSVDDEHCVKGDKE